jgi:hypothetical protein
VAVPGTHVFNAGCGEGGRPISVTERARHINILTRAAGRGTSRLRRHGVRPIAGDIRFFRPNIAMLQPPRRRLTRVIPISGRCLFNPLRIRHAARG